MWMLEIGDNAGGHELSLSHDSPSLGVIGFGRDADVSYLGPGVSYPSILDVSYPELRGFSYLDVAFHTQIK